MNHSDNCFIINANKHTKFRIICFCHAGGYATQYTAWKELLPQDVACIVYERPGSGVRFGQDLISTWDELLKDAWHELKHFLDLPYIVFGHSLGASIGFEFCKLVELNSKPQPRALVIGDRESPKFMPDKLRYELSDSLFIETLVSDYELDHKIINNSEIMEMFMPILRNDFKLADTYYLFSDTANKQINCPIIVIRPERSIDSLESHIAWKNETKSQFNLVDVEGGHFFNFDSPKVIISMLIELMHLEIAETIH